ncbi:MAG TPA: VWA domain-containing protein [Actinomycetota bacterium]
MDRAPERASKRVGEESGAVVVLFALVLVVLFGAVAFAIDLSRLFHERQVLQNAVDFGALAGAQELPAQGATAGGIAEAEARKVTLDNAPWLDPATINISFKCVVGDRDGDGQADLSDVPFICGPSSGTWTTDWKVKRGRAQHLCNPYAGDKCNTVVVRTSNIVNYIFAPVIGIQRGNTGSVSAASCRGACGAEPNPLDVVMVIDRTGSMTSTDLANAKNAALSVLDFYDSSEHHVGVVALPYGRSAADPCNVADPQLYPQAAASFWQVSPLSSDYDNANGTLNTSSSIVQRINCLRLAGNPVIRVNGTVRTSAGHTNLGDPLDAAREMLSTQGRSDVEDIIIFMTDGEANQPDTMLPCNYLNTKANIAKAEDQTIYTIGYGVAGARCSRDSSGPFNGRYASTNLALAATDSTDDVPGGCGPLENRDGDNYFCESGSGDLEPVFRQVAAATLGHSRLVEDL